MCKLFNQYEKEIERLCNENGLDFEKARSLLSAGEKMTYGCSITTPKKVRTDCLMKLLLLSF